MVIGPGARILHGYIKLIGFDRVLVALEVIKLDMTEIFGKH